MKKRWLETMIVILVVGIINCSKNVDSRLNGIWEDKDKDIIKLNSGRFECLIKDIPTYKGTYTTTNEHITLTNSQVNGTIYRLESRWYSKKDLSKTDLTEDYDEVFSQYTVKYRVNDNTVTFIYDDNDTETLTKVSREKK